MGDFTRSLFDEEPAPTKRKLFDDPKPVEARAPVQPVQPEPAVQQNVQPEPSSVPQVAPEPVQASQPTPPQPEPAQGTLEPQNAAPVVQPEKPAAPEPAVQPGLAQAPAAPKSAQLSPESAQLSPQPAETAVQPQVAPETAQKMFEAGKALKERGEAEAKLLSAVADPLDPTRLPEMREPVAPVDRGHLGDLGVAAARGLGAVAQGATSAYAGADRIARDFLNVGANAPSLLPGAKAAGQVAENLAMERGAAMPQSKNEASNETFYGVKWRDVTQGVESFVQSAAPMALGGAIGGTAGALVGAGTGATSYGLGEYERFQNEAVAKGLNPNDTKYAALASAISETGTEFLSDAISLMIGGGLAKGALKKPVSSLLDTGFKTLFKTFAEIVGVESATELLNSGIQAEAAKAVGLDDRGFWDRIKEDAPSILVSSVLFGLMGGAIRFASSRATRNALTNPETDFKDRVGAIREVFEELKKVDEGAAGAWLLSASDALRNNKPVVIDQVVEDLKPKGAPDAQRQTETQALLDQPGPTEAALTEEQKADPSWVEAARLVDEHLHGKEQSPQQNDLSPEGEAGPSYRRRESQPGDADKYFQRNDKSQTVDLDELVPSERPSEDKVQRAVENMKSAAEGGMTKREPLQVFEREDGQLVLRDGNSTFGALKSLGEKSAEVRVSLDITQRTSKKDNLDTPEGVKAYVAKLRSEAQAVRPEFEKQVSDWAQQFGGQAKFRGKDGLKAEESIWRNINGKYKGNPTKVKDILAGSIFFENQEELQEAIKHIQRTATWLELDDKFEYPTELGYQDASFKYALSNGHVAELQLHHTPKLGLKNYMGHGIFEAWRMARDLRVDHPEFGAVADTLADLSRRYYALADAVSGFLRNERSGADPHSLSAFFNQTVSGIREELPDISTMASRLVTRSMAPEEVSKVQSILDALSNTERMPSWDPNNKGASNSRLESLMELSSEETKAPEEKNISTPGEEGKTGPTYRRDEAATDEEQTPTEDTRRPIGNAALAEESFPTGKIYGPIPTRGPLAADQINRELAGVIAKLKGVVDVVAVDSVDDLPPHILDVVKRTNGELTPAFVDPETGAIYLIGENHDGREDLYQSIRHELVHKGLSTLADRMAANDPELKSAAEAIGRTLDALFAGREADVRAFIKSNPGYVGDLLNLGDKANTDPFGTPERRRRAAEEWLASLAEHPDNLPKWYDRYIAAVREFFRKLFPNMRMTNAEVRNLIRKSYEAMEAAQYRAKVEGEPVEAMYRRIMNADREPVEAPAYRRRDAQVLVDKAFQNWVEQRFEAPAFKKWAGKNTEVYQPMKDGVHPEKGPMAVVALHATTWSNIEEFDRFKGEINANYLGRGDYFTDSPVDADKNYSTVNGPDFRNRAGTMLDSVTETAREDYGYFLDMLETQLKKEVQQGNIYHAEMMATLKNFEEYDSIDEAMDEIEGATGLVDAALAGEVMGALKGPSDGATYPVIVRFKKPLYYNTKNPTEFSMRQKGKLGGQALVEALRQVGEEFSVDGDTLAGATEWMLREYDGLTPVQLATELSRNFHFEHYDSGALVGPNTVLAEAFRIMGFDGAVMNAGRAFPGMQGTHVSDDTGRRSAYHYISWAEGTTKSLFNRGTFDDTNRLSYRRRNLDATIKEDNRPSIIVGGKPGEFSYRVDSINPKLKQKERTELYKELFPPFASPTQFQQPNLDALREKVNEIMTSEGVKGILENDFGLENPEVIPIQGMWEGKMEPSFVIEADNMSQEVGEKLAAMFGLAFAQDAVFSVQPFHGQEDFVPTYYIGHGEMLTKEELGNIFTIAKNEGFEGASSSVDGRAVKLMHFDDENATDEEKKAAFDEFTARVKRVAKEAGLTKLKHVEVASTYVGSKTYAQRLGLRSAEETSGDRDRGTGRPGLQGRIISHLVVPYAQASGSQGWRLDPERLGERFGLSQEFVKQLTDELRPKAGRSTVGIAAGTEKLDVLKSGRGGSAVTVDDIAWALQNRQAEFGLIKPGDHSDEAKALLADAMALEAIYHMAHGGKSAIGWYDAELRKAKGVFAEVFPELATDKDARTAFNLLWGIASQGATVSENSITAARVYSDFRSNGDFRGAVEKHKKSFGKEANAIYANFMKVADMVALHGWMGTRDLLSVKRTSAEWNALFRNNPEYAPLASSTLEGKNRVSTGWFAFGPKIGSFINNLNGNFDTATVDLWASRTWNRHLGYAFRFSPLAEAPQFQRFQEAMFKDLGGDALDETGQRELKDKLNDVQVMLDKARELYAVYSGNNFKDRSELNRAAKNWVENRDHQQYTPRNTSEILFQQDVFAATRERVSQLAGQEITIADLQAVLWYYEKNLYKTLGVTDNRSAPMSYSEAAIYVVDQIAKGRLHLSKKERDAAAKKDPAPDAPHYRRRDGAGPLFYSSMVESLSREGVLPVQAETGKAMLDEIMGIQKTGKFKTKGGMQPVSERFKEQELRETGLDKFLFAAQGPVTRAQVLSWLNTNAIRVEEKVLRAEPDSLWDQYDMQQNPEMDDRYDEDGEYEGTEYDVYQIGGRGQKDYTELLFYHPSANDYVADHFPENNRGLIAHMRFNTRMSTDGKKVMFIEEVQSDLHKDGVQKGYREGKRPATPLHDKLNDEASKILRMAERDLQYKKVGALKSQGEKTFYKDSDSGVTVSWFYGADKNYLGLRIGGDKGESTVYAKRFFSNENDDNGANFRSSEFTASSVRDALLKTMPPQAKKALADEKLAREAWKDLVPDAPLKGNAWKALTLKRAAGWAAENGFDAVAWTSASDQVDRWTTATRAMVDGITWRQARVAGETGKTVPVLVVEGLKKGEQVYSGWYNPDGSKFEYQPGDVYSLQETFSKEIAEKILAAPEGKLEEGDIVVGGQNFVNLYDKTLVNVVNDLFKKHGAKARQIELQLEDGARPFQGFDITDSLAQAALGDGFPLYRRRNNNGPLGAFANSTESTWARIFVRGFQDKYSRLKNLQGFIEKATGSPIADSMNAYMAETLMHGKVRNDIDVFMKEILDPILGEMSKKGVELDDLSTYLMAMHAPERNAYIASINPAMPDGGSGMTTAEARAVIRVYQQQGKLADLRAIAEKVWDMNRANLDYMEAAGLIDAQTKAVFRNQYQFYVPLKGWADEQDAGLHNAPVAGAVKGFDVKNNGIKRALGRSSIAANPFVTAVLAWQDAIVRAQKNEVGLRMLELVRANPDNDFWTIDSVTPQRSVREVVKRDSQGRIVRDPLGAPVKEKQVVTSWQAPRGPNTMSVFENGRRHDITFEDELLARAMVNLGVEKQQKFIGVMKRFMNVFKAMRTSYNPEFMLSNALRDAGTAAFSAFVEHDASMVAKIMADAPKAFYAVLGESGGKTTGDWVKLYKEFKQIGGATGFLGIADLESQTNEIKAKLEKANGWGAKAVTANLTSVAKELGSYVDRMNEASENMLRLSYYKQLLDQGLSKEQAANKAKNLTVNFNRKGEWSGIADAFVPFFNASVQGSAKMFQLLSTPKGQKAGAAIMGAAAFMAIMNAFFLSDDDDDDKKFWDKIGQIEKERSMIFMLPGMKDRYARVPMGYGVNAFWNAGTALADGLRTGKPVQASWRIASGALNAFNPLGSLDDPGDVAKWFVPWFGAPAIEIMANKDFSGRPIYKPADGFGPEKPGFQRGFKGDSAASKWLSETLNTATGGNKARPGVISIPPGVFDHIGAFFGGAVGSTVSRALGTSVKAAEGGDVEPREVPGLRVLYRDISRGQTSKELHDAINEIETLRAEYKAGVFNPTPENKAMLGLYAGINPLQRRAKWLNNQILEAKGAEKSRLEDTLEKEQLRFLKLYNNARNAGKKPVPKPYQPLEPVPANADL